ncbi:MAG: thymidylate kinase, partial [Rhodobacterales bacterium]
DHLEKTIRPALARGEVVITDRFADSTRVFQGLTRGDLSAIVDRLHDLMIGMEPDLTLLFDLDPAIGLARATARAGAELRFEDMGLDFQTKARAGFLALAKAHARFRVIDADADPDTVAARVRSTLAERLGTSLSTA